MSTYKMDKKIKKLNKAHVWPSVLFLVSSVLTAAVIYGYVIAISLMNILNERLDSACASAVSVISSLDALAGNEETALDNLRTTSVLSDALYVYGADGSVITGYGEETCGGKFMDKLPTSIFDEIFLNIDYGSKYASYSDTDRKRNLLAENGDLNFFIFLTSDSLSAFMDADPKSGAALFSARFWVESMLSDGRRVMMKCSAPLYYRDFANVVEIGAKALLLMLLPVCFFFINVLVSIRSQHRMTRLLYTDPVTTGSSYVYFEQASDKILNTRRSAGRLFAMADVTLMKYSSYRNFHGVRAAEALLAEVDKDIRARLDKKEICAHSGKSSFALLLRCPDVQSAKDRIQALVNELSAKHDEHCITFHAGLYCFEPKKGCTITPGDCLSLASVARASLPDENVSSFIMYNDNLLEDQRWEHKVEERMQEALDNEEFKVYLQPKYDPLTNELAGAEALIRWINETDGFISPGRFIPIFENNGFITKIDDYMISHVAKLQSEWLAEGKSVVPVSVNVSRAHFATPDLARHICELVDEYKLPHHLLEIELTESAFFDDKNLLLKTVNELRELGFEISMDDFGAGYSSLNSLKDLPLDVLKLDAEFFRGEDSRERGEIVVSQAIQLAKSLNMRIVAEGVEKKEQVDFLAGHGCDMIQGFYFAKPMPVEEYVQRLH